MQQKNKFNTAYDKIIQESPQLGGGTMSNLRSAENGGGLNVGGKGMNMGPEAVSLLDILAQIEREKRKQRPESPIIAYPLQNKIPEDLAELVERAADIAGMFVQARKSPVFKNHEKGDKAAKNAIKKLKHVGAVLMSLRDDLDDLVVEY